MRISSFAAWRCLDQTSSYIFADFRPIKFLHSLKGTLAGRYSPGWQDASAHGGGLPSCIELKPTDAD